MKLDRHALAAERVWREKHWEEALATVRYMLEHVLTVDIPGALQHISYDDARISGEHTHADAAGQIAYSLVNAVSNSGLRNLVADGHALARVIESERDLLALKDELPSDILIVMDSMEDARQDVVLAKSLREQQEREERDAAQCTKHVFRGRGPSSRCGNKGIGLDSDGKQRCRIHGGMKEDS